MAQIPMLAQDSNFYKLITGSLNAVRGYKDIATFYAKEFDAYFQASEWRNILEVGESNQTGTVRQTIGGKSVPVMAAYVADDGDAPKIGNEGFELRTIEMLKSKLSYAFNEKSFEDAQNLLDYGAAGFNANAVFNSFLKDNLNLIGGMNVLRSYSAYQMESTGQLFTTATNKAGGMQGLLIDYGVPADNKFNAGFGQTVPAAWSDADANPIQDLIDLQKHAEDNDIDYGVFRMNKATFIALKDHATTKAAVAQWKTGYLVAAADIANVIVTEADVKAYLDALGLVPIEIVEYKAKSQVLDPTSQTLKYRGLTAFADDTVLLRPSGYVGFYDWKRPNNLFATVSDPMFYAEGGMTTIQQLTSAKNKSTEFIAEAIGLPVPYDVSQWLYLTTNVAHT